LQLRGAGAGAERNIFGSTTLFGTVPVGTGQWCFESGFNLDPDFVLGIRVRIYRYQAKKENYEISFLEVQVVFFRVLKFLV
jgi:hypothetical protein